MSRTQLTPACTFASTAHAGCRVLRTVQHYGQSKLGHSACGRRRARALTHDDDHTVNREHITFTDIIQYSTLTSRFHDTQTLQYTVNLTIDKIQSMKLIKVQPIPLVMSFSKDQNSKLGHLFDHVSVKREVRALSFKL